MFSPFQPCYTTLKYSLIACNSKHLLIMNLLTSVNPIRNNSLLSIQEHEKYIYTQHGRKKKSQKQHKY